MVSVDTLAKNNLKPSSKIAGKSPEVVRLFLCRDWVKLSIEKY